MSPETSTPSHLQHQQQQRQQTQQHDWHQDSASRRPTPLTGKPTNALWWGKGKNRAGSSDKCYLLHLPEDVVYTIMSRLAPRSLLRLSETCKALYDLAKDDTLWRHSYVNHHLDGAVSRDFGSGVEVAILARSCSNISNRGWKKEALGKVIMMDEWETSKSSIVLHTPPTGLIHSISLCYPPFMPIASRSLVVGKNRLPLVNPASPNPVPRSDPSSPQLLGGPKMTHRQKYEATVAATTRAPPFMLSASLSMGGVVRSDPVSGKVSKGFWGPGREANFHLRPHIDPLAEPSAIYLSTRSQEFILWGLRTGGVVYTSVQTRQHATHGGRAWSLNVYCDPRKSHQGQVNDIWISEGQSDPSPKWVTAGRDGTVKLWQLHPGTSTSKSNKKSHIVDGSIDCVFTSPIVETGLPGRSEEVKRRQNARPDDVVLARYDAGCDVVCGVTTDGDLRVWFGASDDVCEVRVDLGSAEAEGEIKTMEMVAKQAQEEVTASIFIHRHRSHLASRYNITKSGAVKIANFTTTNSAPLNVIQPFLTPSLSISTQKARYTPMLARIVVPNMTSESVTPPALDQPLTTQPATQIEMDKGKFIIAGDISGCVHMWAWDGDDKERKIIRSWEASEGKITALDVSCGLVAVGSYDGYIRVFDPSPARPKLLRTFHASHLSPGEQLVASSDQPDARYYTVNQIVLENDLVVASIGRKVFAWKAGSGKGKRHNGKDGGARKKGGLKGEGKGISRGFDMKMIHADAEDDYDSLAQTQTNPHETLEREAMQEMGLEDANDALQYALMLSMEASEQSNLDMSAGVEDEYEPGPSRMGHRNESSWREEEEMDDETMDAIRQVEAFQKAEEEETRKILEMVNIAEGDSA